VTPDSGAAPLSNMERPSAEPGGVVGIENVSKLYASAEGKPTWALLDVSLAVRDGEFLCAIGPSGCGKTTLLNLIAGFIEPTRGRLSFDGKTITGPAPERGVVFQEYALFPWLTALRNVEFGLKMRGVAKADRRQRAMEALELVGLAGAAKRYPFELSGGMRQRVAVARALVNHPRILLMDEPFAAVDALTRASLQTELLRIWEDIGITVLFITHNIEEAVYLGNRILVMSPNPGRIQETVEVSLSRPRSRSDPEFGRLYAHVSSIFYQQGESSP